jgi:hypothetical protein
MEDSSSMASCILYQLFGIFSANTMGNLGNGGAQPCKYFVYQQPTCLACHLEYLSCGWVIYMKKPLLPSLLAEGAGLLA